MTDIVERLRAEAFDAVNWDGETMKQWDKIRKQAETLPGSDLPRLMFQGLIESLAELMVESACEIECLRNAAQLVRSQPLRDQFERWAETDHRAIEPEQFEDRADDNNQYYQDDSDNSAFIGWKAALSSAQRA
jgi:deoxyribodipyrimidine photolyase-like uncharacterized protein